MTLGGSIFVRNAIRYDYCVVEAMLSLAAVCDRIVVLDCGSDDGTLEMLNERVYECQCPATIASGAHWECAPDHERLAILANSAKALLDCSWHFMLQADEVVHESSCGAIREAIKAKDFQSFEVRRINLYGDPWHYVKYDLPLEEKPCNDHPVRLGKSHLNAIGDAESIEAVDTGGLVDAVSIFHYGFVRKPDAIIRKNIDFLGWFFGPDGKPDPRFVKMAEDGEYRWQDIMRPDQLAELKEPHPAIMKEWLKERWFR